jgi:hypothetical protein
VEDVVAVGECGVGLKTGQNSPHDLKKQIFKLEFEDFFISN